MATKFHEIIGMLDTHLNKNKVNANGRMEEFHALILIPSQTRGIMVLLRKVLTI